MSNHTDDGTNQTEQDKRISHEMESRGLDPENVAQRARYERDQKLVDAGRITQREASQNMDRLLTDQEDKKTRDAARKRQVELGLIPVEQKRDDSSRTEQTTGTWRDRLLQTSPWQIQPQNAQSPEAQRNQIRQSAPEATPEGPQQEKKQIEVDWRLALTDPAYKRQAKELERSEQKERSGEQRQVQGPQRSPGR